MSSDPNQNPVNPLPPLVVVLFLAIVGIEAVLSLGAQGFIGGPSAVGWRLWTIQSYAFSSEIFGWMVETGRYRLLCVRRPTVVA